MAQASPQVDTTTQENKISIISLPNEILIHIAEYIAASFQTLRSPRVPRYRKRFPEHRIAYIFGTPPREPGLKYLVPLSLTNRLFADITLTIFQRAACRKENSTLAIYFAAANGDEQMVRLLLAKGEDIGFRVKREGSETVYVYPPGIHDEAVVRYVVESGPNFGLWGSSALEWAVTHQHPALMRRVLERGADVDAWNTRSRGFRSIGENALHESAKLGDGISVGILLKNGVDINAQDPLGKTALHRAALGGHLGIIKQLIKSGADVNIMDKAGFRVLSYLNYSPGQMHLPHFKEIKSLAWLLLETIDESSKGTLLRNAVFYEHLELARKILRTGADVNARGIVLDTPLHLAVLRDNIPIVKLLLANGADINACDLSKRTALHYAVDFPVELRHQTKEMIEALLEYGADINAQDKSGNTPLMAARRVGGAVLALLGQI